MPKSHQFEREALEARILTLVTGFERMTGLYVKSIEPFHTLSTPGEEARKTTKHTTNIRVTAEL